MRYQNPILLKDGLFIKEKGFTVTLDHNTTVDQLLKLIEEEKKKAEKKGYEIGIYG